MLKRMLIFGAVVIALFTALWAVTALGEPSADIEGNPFEKDQLHEATIAQLDDPLYQNQILPDELEAALEEEEELLIYYYQPQCEYCQQTTPIISEVADEMGVEFQLHNVTEFDEAWAKYDLEAVPSLNYYKDGEVEYQIVGAADKESYANFIEEYMK